MSRSSSAQSDYFEIFRGSGESNVTDGGTDDAGLRYVSSKCAKRHVVHVRCRSFKCGLRPRNVHSNRAR